MDYINGKSILDSLHKTFPKIFVEAGTLLGCIRDGGFIKWDKDIDTGILCENFNESQLNQLSEFKIVKKAHWDYAPATKFIDRKFRSCISKIKLEKYEIRICLNIYTPGIKSYRYFYPGNKKSVIRIPEEFISDTVTKPFHDTTVNVPIKYMDYIKFMYGESWQTPKDNYIHSKEHRNNRRKFRIPL